MDKLVSFIFLIAGFAAFGCSTFANRYELKTQGDNIRLRIDKWSGKVWRNFESPERGSVWAQIKEFE